MKVPERSGEPLEILKKYWGYEAFRPQQMAVIEALLEGQDVWARLATGAGKSLCFQVPTLCFARGLCLVISPLVSLMQDQIRDLYQRGIRAATLDASMRADHMEAVLNGCQGGQTRFLYLTAERLDDPAFVQNLRDLLEVVLIVVDEAHCISEWGHDFRPAYQRLGALREWCPSVPVLALSASAPDKVEKDIRTTLRMEKAVAVKGSLYRPNLHYGAIKTARPIIKVCHMLHKQPGSALVYVSSRKQCEYWARALRQNNLNAVYYHAGLSFAERKQNQMDWMRNKIRIMVCTSAFGMGIDKADVRWVIHGSVPSQLSAYVQESGRAGRDHKAAYAVLLYTSDAVARAQARIANQVPDLALIKRVYEALYNYAKIALGSGAFHSCKIAIKPFAKTYGLDPARVYYAMDYLTYAGLIQLDARGRATSRVSIQANKADLYRFQVTQPQEAPVIEALVRRYGAQLEYYGFIREEQLARDTLMPLADVVKALDRAEKAHVIHYIRRHTEPLLTFLAPRQSLQALSFDEAHLKARRQRKEEELAAVSAYLAQETGCRMETLVKALGGDAEGPCGRCDLCRKG